MAAVRGEVWTVALSPVKGHEQGGTRPALIVSHDELNRGPAGIVIVLPITGTDRRIPLHVRVNPPEGGLSKVSFIKCEDVRSVSTERLRKRCGAVTPQTLALVEDALREGALGAKLTGAGGGGAAIALASGEPAELAERLSRAGWEAFPIASSHASLDRGGSA